LQRVAKKTASAEKSVPFSLLVKDFLKDPANIGTISQSSSALAGAMTDNLCLQPTDVVVEFGPGTGAITAHIRRHTHNYLGIERNPRFTSMLQGRFPDLHFVNGLAENSSQHHLDLGLAPPKAIVCGLPLSLLPAQAQDSIIAALDPLMPSGCTFRAYQYAHSYLFPPAIRFRRKMNSFLGPAKPNRLVLRNLPPAYVLTWHRS
jgi:phosphatidylethanolamine/phosphatidyl-N-methylethanolamine N-methyltransferase